jgi:hypothetical protein
MTTFDLREWRFRKPFKPFSLHLKNGDVVPVWDADSIGWGGPGAIECTVLTLTTVRHVIIADIVEIREMPERDD